MMKKIVFCLLAGAVFSFLPVSSVMPVELSFCRQAGAAASGVQDEDFGYQGLLLGDDEAKMQELLGEPLYDKPQTVQGVSLKVYEYQDFQIGVAVSTGKVVDICLSSDQYVLRRNVRQGATSYWLQKVYGKTERQWQEGVPYFIYSRPGHPHEHLLLELDSGDWHLKGVRITALPLTDEEADQMTIDGSDISEGLETAALEVNHGDITIDTSSLPTGGTPELTVGGRAE